MASNVTPSIPGAPSFCLAIAYASRSVSILQTWTYSPQKRQDGSAFALTYRLLLRSCKLMGAFVISPLPPVLLEPLQTAGPLRSADITPLPRYYRPSRIPLAVHRLPGVTGYTASLLRRFPDGARRVSPVAWHDLVTVLSLPTPPKCFAASVLATLHAAFARKVRARPSGFSTFEAIWVHLHYGPATRWSSFSDGFVNRLQDSQFPSFLLFKLRGLDSYPWGTFPH